MTTENEWEDEIKANEAAAAARAADEHAKRRAAEERKAEQKAKAIEERKTLALAKLAAARKKLAAKDTSVTVPIQQHDRMEATVKQLLPAEELEAFNADLRQKSGEISYRDIAFIGIIHRRSVLENGRKEERFKDTSPFSRIAKLSTETKYREKPFDNRQLRYALTILEALGYTAQLTEAVHTGNKNERRAATWSLSCDPIWTRVFEFPT